MDSTGSYSCALVAQMSGVSIFAEGRSSRSARVFAAKSRSAARVRHQPAPQQFDPQFRGKGPNASVFKCGKLRAKPVDRRHGCKQPPAPEAAGEAGKRIGDVGLQRVEERGVAVLAFRIRLRRRQTNQSRGPLRRGAVERYPTGDLRQGTASGTAGGCRDRSAPPAAVRHGRSAHTPGFPGRR